ncbi:trans-aconitate 2-methyltransferase [Maritimibacter sp. HL-12]|uniref:class I SAM-dependent methyltransferase n=1 Tax=Maritimibacter sp. HL-12 TaxID=1162418 RepID=UPI000A0F25C6|nr:class I SAM-dependent methyltransferase [Maritimibacter sp. HL-12]SMH57352.1 Methyltransferase domain-containing protein [Maritimibacter sp. HL-12]
MNDPFFTLHADMPREGPGDRESLDWAMGVANLPRDAEILDAGCGPGADIEGLLAHAPHGHVTAVDLHPDFIGQVRARWGDDPRVTAEVADMRAPEGPFDLVWSAGALYFLGITEGLGHFRSRLAPGGAVAFSELVWLGEDRPAAAVALLAQEYPPMGDLATLQARIEASGYALCGVRVLSDAAWEAYYAPLEARIARLRPGGDAALARVLDEAETEAALWRAHRAAFGYALAVVRPK